jgi:hypothetical protein
MDEMKNIQKKLRLNSSSNGHQRQLLFQIGWFLIKPPRSEVVGGYTSFTMFVRPSVDKSYVVR